MGNGIADRSIHYRSGRANAKADALSRYPQPRDEGGKTVVPGALVAAVEGNPTEDGEPGLRDRQCTDPELRAIVDYLEQGILPSEDRKSWELTLSSSAYMIVEGVLYRVAADKTLRIIPPPQADREKLFHEAHVQWHIRSPPEGRENP